MLLNGFSGHPEHFRITKRGNGHSHADIGVPLPGPVEFVSTIKISCTQIGQGLMTVASINRYSGKTRTDQ